MAGRALTRGEMQMARTVFLNEISYAAVRVFNEKFVFFQPTDRAMAPNGNIYYAPGNPDYVADFSLAQLHPRATFIHELTHVWQHQHGINVIVSAPFSREYEYLPLTGDKPFRDHNIEQQGQIVRDYFYLLNNFRNSRWPDISVYRSVIPWLGTQ